MSIIFAEVVGSSLTPPLFVRFGLFWCLRLKASGYRLRAYEHNKLPIKYFSPVLIIKDEILHLGNGYEFQGFGITLTSGSVDQACRAVLQCTMREQATVTV